MSAYNVYQQIYSCVVFLNPFSHSHKQDTEKPFNPDQSSNKTHRNQHDTTCEFIYIFFFLGILPPATIKRCPYSFTHMCLCAVSQYRVQPLRLSAAHESKQSRSVFAVDSESPERLTHPLALNCPQMVETEHNSSVCLEQCHCNSSYIRMLTQCQH